MVLLAHATTDSLEVHVLLEEGIEEVARVFLKEADEMLALLPLVELKLLSAGLIVTDSEVNGLREISLEHAIAEVREHSSRLASVFRARDGVALWSGMRSTRQGTSQSRPRGIERGLCTECTHFDTCIGRRLRLEHLNHGRRRVLGCHAMLSGSGGSGRSTSGNSRVEAPASRLVLVQDGTGLCLI